MLALATYRLRFFPPKPDTLEIVKVEFDETAMQSTWNVFSETYGKTRVVGSGFITKAIDRLCSRHEPREMARALHFTQRGCCDPS